MTRIQLGLKKQDLTIGDLSPGELFKNIYTDDIWMKTDHHYDGEEDAIYCVRLGNGMLSYFCSWEKAIRVSGYLEIEA